MTKENIQLDKPYRNMDDTTPSSAIQLVYNGIINVTDKGKVSIQSRPGLSLLANLGITTNIEGLFWWDMQKVLLVVTGGRLFKIYDAQGSFSEITGVTLPIGRKVTFAEGFDSVSGNNYVFIANGGRIAYTDGNTIAYIADVNAPTMVSHIVIVDTYLICNSLQADQGILWFGSTVGSPFDWTSAPLIYTCQLIPDTILSIQEVDRKVYFVGQIHTEVWYNTGTPGDPFSIVGGVGISSGSANPYSVIKIQNLLGGFNNYRDIGIVEGYNLNVVSIPYARVLNELGIVSDCEAEYVASLDGHKYLVFNFVNDRRTIVYDLTTASFYEWSSYDEENGNYGLFKGRCYAYCQAWGLHIMGDKDNSNIYVVDKDNQTDNGVRIKTIVKTGVYDWGTSNMKKSTALYLNFRRGEGKQGDEYTEPSIFLRWADNGKQFGNAVQLGLGALGNSYPIIALRPMGTYRTRQYEITLGDTTKLVLSSLDEDVQVLNV